MADVTADAYFAIVPEWVLDSGVSGNAVKLYAILRRYADNATGQAHPSRRTLAKRMGFSRPQSVDPIVQELTEAGAVRTFERWTEAGDQDSNGYHLIATAPHRVVRESAPRVVRQSAPGVVRESAHELEPLELEPIELENPMVAAFDEAWKHWPKKRQRKPALEKFERVVKAKSISVEALVAAISAHGDAYTAGGYPEQFVPGLLPWLNQERWDEPLPAPRNGRGQERLNEGLALVARLREEEAHAGLGSGAAAALGSGR